MKIWYENGVDAVFETVMIGETTIERSKRDNDYRKTCSISPKKQVYL